MSPRSQELMAMAQQTYAEAGRFDSAPLSQARKTQPDRERADYDAVTESAEYARGIVETAELFVAAVG